MPSETGKRSELGRCDPCIVRHRGLCNALTLEELRRFRRGASRRAFEPGQAILCSEESPDFFATVVSGVVKLSKLLSDGRQQIVGLRFPPDCIGQPLGRANPYFAEAATAVELCCFPHSGFQRMLADFSGLRQRLLELTVDELDSARDWMVLLGRKTATERVASLLLMLATRVAPAIAADVGGGSFQLHLKRAEIADFLGLTYETVSRQLSALQKDGIIRLDGTRRFTVRDLAALSGLAG